MSKKKEIECTNCGTINFRYYIPERMFCKEGCGEWHYTEWKGKIGWCGECGKRILIDTEVCPRCDCSIEW